MENTESGLADAMASAEKASNHASGWYQGSADTPDMCIGMIEQLIEKAQEDPSREDPSRAQQYTAAAKAWANVAWAYADLHDGDPSILEEEKQFKDLRELVKKAVNLTRPFGLDLSDWE